MNIYQNLTSLSFVIRVSLYIDLFISTYTINLNTITIYDSGRILLTQYILVTQCNVYIL